MIEALINTYVRSMRYDSTAKNQVESIHIEESTGSTRGFECAMKNGAWLAGNVQLPQLPQFIHKWGLVGRQCAVGSVASVCTHM